MPKPFNGKIKLDVRDSTPDWEPFLPPARRRARRTSWSCSTTTPASRRGRRSAAGSRCRRCKRLADNGLTYTQWHTTALCSPTRSCFLTGRNHHQNGVRLHLRGRRPASRATARTSRRRTGRSPRCCARAAGARSGSARTTTSRSTSWTMGASKKNWPLAPGLRPLLRLHRRRDEPVVSGPRRGQPLHRAAVPARGRLPPLEGSRRPGRSDDPRRQADRAATSRGSCGSARARTTRRTTRRRSTSTSTRGSSTTATRPTASGCCRA